MKHFNPILFSTLLSISFFCLFHGSEAKAARGESGVYFEETFFPVYVSKTESDNFPDATSAPYTGIGTDLRSTLGYVFSNKVFVGATYNLYNLSASRDSHEGASSVLGRGGEEETTSRFEFGPTVGYINNGWKVMLTYFIDGQREVTHIDKDETGPLSKDYNKDTKASGFQLAFGYNFAVSSWFEIGPSIVYRTISYKTLTRTDGLDNSPTYTDITPKTAVAEANLTPMISMAFKF